MRSDELRIPDFLRKSTYLAVLTDQVLCGRYRADGEPNALDAVDGNRLLELRVFNQEGEYRWYRENLSCAPAVRIIRDAEAQKEYFDEIHYLDQDSRCTASLDGGTTRFRTTGGGVYVLPFSPSVRKIQVRTYLETGINGVRYAGDWRIVGFLNGAGEALDEGGVA